MQFNVYNHVERPYHNEFLFFGALSGTIIGSVQGIILAILVFALGKPEWRDLGNPLIFGSILLWIGIKTWLYYRESQRQIQRHDDHAAQSKSYLSMVHKLRSMTVDEIQTIGKLLEVPHIRQKPYLWAVTGYSIDIACAGHLYIYDDGIRVHTPGKERFYAWDKIKEVAYSEVGLYIETDKGVKPFQVATAGEHPFQNTGLFAQVTQKVRDLNGKESRTS